MNSLDQLFKNGSTTTTAVEPEPDRKSELLSQIRDLDVQLGDHDAAARHFRSRNFAYVNGAEVMLYKSDGDPFEARSRIEREWKRLSDERQKIQDTRNKVLAELARL